MYLEPLAITLLILGIMGILASFVLKRCCTRNIAPPTDGDRHLVEHPSVQDGALRHRTVDQEKWGVTLRDLRQFKRLVHDAVMKGIIKPHDRDQFLPSASCWNKSRLQLEKHTAVA